MAYLHNMSPAGSDRHDRGSSGVACAIVVFLLLVTSSRCASRRSLTGASAPARPEYAVKHVRGYVTGHAERETSLEEARGVAFRHALRQLVEAVYVEISAYYKERRELIDGRLTEKLETALEMRSYGVAYDLGERFYDEYWEERRDGTFQLWSCYSVDRPYLSELRSALTDRNDAVAGTVGRTLDETRSRVADGEFHVAIEHLRTALVQSREAPISRQYLADLCLTTLSGLLGAMNVEPVRPVGIGLPSSVEFRVFIGLGPARRYLPNIPVRFRLERGTGEVSPSAMTDQEGVASCSVLHMERTRTDNVVAAWIDLSQVLVPPSGSDPRTAETMSKLAQDVAGRRASGRFASQADNAATSVGRLVGGIDLRAAYMVPESDFFDDSIGGSGAVGGGVSAGLKRAQFEIGVDHFLAAGDTAEYRIDSNVVNRKSKARATILGVGLRLLGPPIYVGAGVGVHNLKTIVTTTIWRQRVKVGEETEQVGESGLGWYAKAGFELRLGEGRAALVGEGRFDRAELDGDAMSRFTGGFVGLRILLGGLPRGKPPEEKARMARRAARVPVRAGARPDDAP